MRSTVGAQATVCSSRPIAMRPRLLAATENWPSCAWQTARRLAGRAPRGTRWLLRARPDAVRQLLRDGWSATLGVPPIVLERAKVCAGALARRPRTGDRT